MEAPNNSKAILFEYDGALFWRVEAQGQWTQIQKKATCRSCGSHVKSDETFIASMSEASQFIEHTICESRPDLAELRRQRPPHFQTVLDREPSWLGE